MTASRYELVLNSATIIEQLDRVEPGRWSTLHRVEWLMRLAEIYEDNRVMGDGWGCVLTRCCSDRRKCWAGTDSEDRPGRAPTSDEREQDGSIFWPWIGEQCAVGGVCLVGITPNMDDNSSWSIALEYDIAWHVVAGLGAGKERTPGTSPFHYRAATTAAVVLASLACESLKTWPDPRALPPVLERVARLQMVKCTPRHDRGATELPMPKHCPPRFLAKELAILQRGVIVALGKQPRQALGRIGTLDLWLDEPLLRRGALEIEGHTSAFIGLPHPSARPPNPWEDGQQRLVRNLCRSPLR